MDKIKQKIQELIQNNPKCFSSMVKKNQEMWNWVQHNSKIQTGKISEIIYSAISHESNICVNGNKKRFISINDGFGYCGLTKNCLCAQIEISKKVSKAKANRTQQEIGAENKKREQTILSKTNGTATNNGQTAYAKQKHKEFYDNEENVKKVVKKQQDTLMSRYGVSNSNKIHIPQESLDILDDKEKFVEYLSTRNSTMAILEELQISDSALYSRLNEYQIEWKSANTSFKSKGEIEILDFVRNNCNSEVLSGDRTQIYPNELDIFVPEFNLAIEFCGLYWHSDLFKNKNYHAEKFALCKEKGVKLITIFEDEWKYKTNIVKNLILNSLQRTQTKLNARELTCRKIINSDEREFLNTNHIQGFAQYRNFSYGLYDVNDELVAVMSFKKSTKEVEIIRYATALNTNVRGGFSKILKFAVKNEIILLPIISFSDNRYGFGKLYESTGFDIDKVIKPDYFYTKAKSRYNKENFMKSKIAKKFNVDVADKTESELMVELGYNRIWDCGKIKWKINF